MSEHKEETSRSAGDPQFATLPTEEIQERMNGISSAANIAAIQGVELPLEITMSMGHWRQNWNAGQPCVWPKSKSTPK